MADKEVLMMLAGLFGSGFAAGFGARHLAGVPAENKAERRPLGALIALAAATGALAYIYIITHI